MARVTAFIINVKPPLLYRIQKIVSPLISQSEPEDYVFVSRFPINRISTVSDSVSAISKLQFEQVFDLRTRLVEIFDQMVVEDINCIKKIIIIVDKLPSGAEHILRPGLIINENYVLDCKVYALEVGGTCGETIIDKKVEMIFSQNMDLIKNKLEEICA